MPEHDLSNDFDTLIAAFGLAILAPDDTKRDMCLHIAMHIATDAQMSERDVCSAFFIANLLTEPVCHN